MQQLHMRWNPRPVEPLAAPDGYTLRTYRPGDAAGFVAVNTAITGTPWTVEQFEENMLGQEGIRPEGIFFAVDALGNIVGTTTGWVREGGIGYLHMVSVDPGCRGKKLGELLIGAALDYMAKQGCPYVVLNTDDFRLPAIHLYLKLGFVPVLNGADMEDRWRAILKQLGIAAQPVILDGAEGPSALLEG